jgi:hypothetical protein
MSASRIGNRPETSGSELRRVPTALRGISTPDDSLPPDSQGRESTFPASAGFAQQVRVTPLLTEKMLDAPGNEIRGRFQI